jgi:hypothetical protein
MKAFFFSRHSREKVLIMIFVALVAVVWLLRVERNSRALWLEWRTAAATLATQQQSLDNRTQIEAAAAKAVEHLDPSRTFSSTRLLGELSTIADKIGVRSNTQSEIVGTDRSSLFSINSVQFSLRKTDWDSIKRFYLELSQRSPYIGIVGFSLAAEPGNPTLLNAILQVSSVEITR